MDTAPGDAPERRPLRERIAQRMSRRRSPADKSPSPTGKPGGSATDANAGASGSASGSGSAGGSASGSASPNASAGSSGKPAPATDTTFECNVCFDVPRDPVVTPCGHLYCWPCLYRWMRLHADSPQCPVCKAGVDKRSVVPIYGRGRNEADDPRARAVVDDADEDARGDVPPRPPGTRAAPLRRQVHATTTFGVHHTFGINANADNYDNFAFSTFGLFPSLFGLQIAYPHINEPPRDDQREQNHEEGTSELVRKVFLLLAVFIIIIITTF